MSTEPLVYLACSTNVDDNDTVSLPSGWKFMENSPDCLNFDDYFGAAYINDEKKEMIIAHRGAIPSSIKEISVKHFWEVWFNQKAPAQFEKSVLPFIQHIKNSLIEQNKTDYTISFTGHSLGATLAILCSASTGFPAVVFESPGGVEAINDMIQKGKLPVSALENANQNVVTFNAAPNAINTAQHHPGFDQLFRIYPPYISNRGTLTHLSENELTFYETEIYFLTEFTIHNQHSKKGLYKRFNSATGLPKIYSKPLSWPYGFKEAFSNYLKYDENPHYWYGLFYNAWNTSSQTIPFEQYLMQQLNSSLSLVTYDPTVKTESGITLQVDDSPSEVWGCTMRRDAILFRGGTHRVYRYGNNRYEIITAIPNEITLVDRDSDQGGMLYFDEQPIDGLGIGNDAFFFSLKAHDREYSLTRTKESDNSYSLTITPADQNNCIVKIEDFKAGELNLILLHHTGTGPAHTAFRPLPNGLLTTGWYFYNLTGIPKYTYDRSDYFLPVTYYFQTLEVVGHANGNFAILWPQVRDDNRHNHTYDICGLFFDLQGNILNTLRYEVSKTINIIPNGNPYRMVAAPWGEGYLVTHGYESLETLVINPSGEVQNASTLSSPGECKAGTCTVPFYLRTQSDKNFALLVWTPAPENGNLYFCHLDNCYSALSIANSLITPANYPRKQDMAPLEEGFILTSQQSDTITSFVKKGAINLNPLLISNETSVSTHLGSTTLKNNYVLIVWDNDKATYVTIVHPLTETFFLKPINFTKNAGLSLYVSTANTPYGNGAIITINSIEGSEIYVMEASYFPTQGNYASITPIPIPPINPSRFNNYTYHPVEGCTQFTVDNTQDTNHTADFTLSQVSTTPNEDAIASSAIKNTPNVLNIPTISFAFLSHVFQTSYKLVSHISPQIIASPATASNQEKISNHSIHIPELGSSIALYIVLWQMGKTFFDVVKNWRKTKPTTLQLDATEVEERFSLLKYQVDQFCSYNPYNHKDHWTWQLEDLEERIMRVQTNEDLNDIEQTITAIENNLNELANEKKHSNNSFAYLQHAFSQQKTTQKEITSILPHKLTC